MWIKEQGGSWALAFTYTDPQAGPSAKGAVVVAPITEDQIRTAVDHPNITFRQPIDIILAVEHDCHNGDVYLLAGDVAPRLESELTRLWRSRDRSTFRSANSSTNDGKRMKTRFADVLPGTYTLCICPSTMRGGHDEQPVITRPLTVATAPITVELVLPSLRT